MSGPGENLTRKQETLLSALLSAPTLAAAARTANTSEATARRWLALPIVRRAWLDLRRQTVDAALTTIQTATGDAVETLRACMAVDMPPGVRVRAATAILDTAVRAVELSDLATRLDELEAALAAQQQDNRQGTRRYA